MKPRHASLRALIAGAAAALGLAASGASADVYTWVDAKGNVTVSNLEPPDGARVLHVARESGEAKARAEAARDAARQAELKALSERVAELEKKTDEAPPPAPAPVFYGAPPMHAPPPPQVNVVVMPQETPDFGPAYGCAWVGCAWPAFGYPVFFVPTTPRFHRDHRFGRVDRPHVPAPAMPAHPMARAPLAMRKG